MKRAVELARQGLGNVSPNPLVGCVIVYEGKIIGEGFHKKFGGPHAEVNAINSVIDKSLLSESTLYVNLEPCSHHGKTPPCADLISKNKIKKVVIGHTDPYPLVSGRGIEKLKTAGIEVVQGVLENDVRQLNKRFITFHEQKRPYIILKWAQTTDGFIAGTDEGTKQISNALSQKLVHKQRSEEDAVMVGTNTAATDNPQLNVRHWSGRNPVRIVIDKQLRLAPTLHLFDGSQETLCYTLQKKENQTNIKYLTLREESSLINQIIQDLYERNIQSLIVEGGTKLLNSFLENNLWDEAHVFVSSKKFEKGVSGPKLNIPTSVELLLDDDKLLLFYNK